MSVQEIHPFDEACAAVERAASRFPTLMQTAADREARRIRPLILKDMALKPRAEGKFIWSTNSDAQARARAWVFANLVPRGGKGGRYSRTGALEKATKVTGNFSKTDGVLTLENQAPGSEFVFGDQQVPGHAKAGQPRIADVAEKWQPIVSQRYEDIALTIADPFAGVSQE